MKDQERKEHYGYENTGEQAANSFLIRATFGSFVRKDNHNQELKQIEKDIIAPIKVGISQLSRRNSERGIIGGGVIQEIRNRQRDIAKERPAHVQQNHIEFLRGTEKKENKNQK